MSDPYRPLDLGGKRRPAPPRAPDRRALLRAYLRLRLSQLRTDLDHAPEGNEQDLLHVMLLRARLDELCRLCKGVGLDPATCDWVQLSSGRES